jgi:hypothetical protein
MNLDDLLRDSLRDDRLALPVPADTLDVVRRMRRRRQRLTVATASAGTLALVGIVVVLAPGGGAAPRAAIVPGAPSTSPTPIPGSTPAYYIRNARDWFLTKAQSDAFFAGFQEPSPKPADSVPSPQSSGPLTDRLVAELQAAGVPGVESFRRDEADSGQRGSLSLAGTLPDGRQLTVNRYPTRYPINLDGIGVEGSAKYVTVEDVPGTADAALLIPPHMPGSGSGSTVAVLTPEGLDTGWSSATIPLAQLKAWAYAAARWASDHPT